MKQLVVFGTSLVLSLFTLSAEAKPHGMKECGHPAAVFSKDMELSPEQKNILGDMKAVKKEHRHDRKMEDRSHRLEWMQDFLDGNSSAADVHSDLDRRFEERIVEKEEVQALMFELIETFSDAQRRQALENLQQKRECREEVKSKHASHKERKGPKMKKALFHDIELSTVQQQEAEEIHQQSKEARIDHRESHARRAEILEDLLSGDISSREAERMMRDRAEQKRELTHKNIDHWIDFIDGLSSEQQSQLRVNLDKIEERQTERKNANKERRRQP